MLDPISFARLPTPLHRLDRLSDILGVDLWIKRDDLAGFGMGGNKVRKAEYLLADARRTGATDVITAGAVQSNHARVIAAAASTCGIQCHLILSGPPPEEPRGNVLLDRLADANLYFVPSSTERADAMQSLADRLAQGGRLPYAIPIGGSTGIGALGYVRGFTELSDQLAALPPVATTLVFATSSGGTYGGLLAGRSLTGSEITLLGIRVDEDPGAEEEVARIAAEACELAGKPRPFIPGDAPMRADYVGEGYGIPTEAGLEALRTVWRSEGILLDPVYTGKAMSGLVDLAHRGDFVGRRVVFLHTGGEPSVFSRADLA